MIPSLEKLQDDQADNKRNSHENTAEGFHIVRSLIVVYDFSNCNCGQ